jgi:hypothetical protein
VTQVTPQAESVKNEGLTTTEDKNKEKDESQRKCFSQKDNVSTNDGDAKTDKIVINEKDLFPPKTIPPGEHQSNSEHNSEIQKQMKQDEIEKGSLQLDPTSESLDYNNTASTAYQEQAQERQKQLQSFTTENGTCNVDKYSKTKNVENENSKSVSPDDVEDEDDSWDEDSVPLVRLGGDGARKSLSIPTSSDPNRLSPFSNDYHESSRRFSTDTAVPSRWRKGSTYSPFQQQQQQQQQSSDSSRNSVTRDDPATSSDGVFRSKSVHLLCREASPKIEYPPPLSRKSSFSTISESQRNIYSPPPPRDRRANSVNNFSHPPPPSVPPPPLPNTSYIDRKYRSSENVENNRRDEPKTPTERFGVFRTQFARPSDFRVGYATLRNASSPQVSSTFNSSSNNNYSSNNSSSNNYASNNSSSNNYASNNNSNKSNLNNGSDRIPSRFRRARDHAAAASNPDISRKQPDLPTTTPRNSDFLEQIRLARIEHQRSFDEAKNFDPKNRLFLASRSKSVTSLGGRATTPGPLSSLPPSPSGVDPSQRRTSSRFVFR